jgi:hypothetical protein
MSEGPLGLPDHFLRGVGSQLPVIHPGYPELSYAKEFGPGDDPGLQASELAECMIGWLQEIVACDGGEPAILDVLPALGCEAEFRLERVRLLSQRGPPSTRHAAVYTAVAHRSYAAGRLVDVAVAAGSCFYELVRTRDESDADIVAKARAEAKTIAEIRRQPPPAHHP